MYISKLNIFLDNDIKTEKELHTFKYYFVMGIRTEEFAANSAMASSCRKCINNFKKLLS